MPGNFPETNTRYGSLAPDCRVICTTCACRQSSQLAPMHLQSWHCKRAFNTSPIDARQSARPDAFAFSAWGHSEPNTSPHASCDGLFPPVYTRCIVPSPQTRPYSTKSNTPATQWPANHQPASKPSGHDLTTTSTDIFGITRARPTLAASFFDRISNTAKVPAAAHAMPQP